MGLNAALRIGVYGGAFDPPHLAHEALAREAAAQHRLDKLIVLPMANAWYKARALTAAHHRLAMTRLGFADIPKACVDEMEIERGGNSYTIDSLERIGAAHEHAQIFLLLGSDQLAFFPRWHRWREILQLATLLVAHREESIKSSDQDQGAMQGKIAHLQIQMPAQQISSTQIRALCAQGQAIDAWVHRAVALYIAKHGLYSSTAKIS